MPWRLSKRFATSSSAMPVSTYRSLKCFLSPAGIQKLLHHSPPSLIVNRKPLGAEELLTPLLSITSLSTPLLGSTQQSQNSLGPSDIEQFLQDLAQRFEPDGELEGVLGPVVKMLLFHPALVHPQGLGGSDSSWRNILGGLEALVSVKSIAIMMTKLPEWNPSNSTPAHFERLSLMGPLCRLGVFPMEWVSGDVEVTFQR